MHGYSDAFADSICTYGSGGVNSLFSNSAGLFILGTIMFGLVLFALVSILIMYMASRNSRLKTQAIPEEPTSNEAMEILRKRYATGEISTKELRSKRDDLR